jgi:Dolichyl-phosphate-mannose-protein mannosyltransferase
MSDKRPVGVWVLLFAFVVLAVTYSVVTPIFEASDEVWHYPVVQYIAAGHGLPAQTPPDRPGLWKQEASQAPLYYALAGLLTSWIDTGDLNATLRPNPHAAIGVVTPDGNINLAAHDPVREAWPWRGTVLAVHVTRLLSVALSTATVYLVYRLGREAFPDRSDIALGAAAFTAFTPMFTFISGSVNNDNLVVPLCALALLLMIRQSREARGEERRLMLGWLVLGMVIGLATLAKLSGLLLLLQAALTGVLVAWRRGLGSGASHPPTLKHRAESVSQLKLAQGALAQRFTTGLCHLFAAGLAIGLPMLALTGWWFWRNWQLYRDPTGMSMFNLYFTRSIPADLAQIWSERTSFLYGYWGNFGGVNLPIPGAAYTVLNALLVLAIAGLLLCAIRRSLRKVDIRRSTPDTRHSTFDIRPVSFIVLWGVMVFIAWLFWTRTTWSSQGRLVFYALPSYSILIVAGLAVWLPRCIAPYALGALSVGMALLSAAMPFTVITPAYARSPQLTPEQVASIPHRTDVTFGGALALLGYDAPAASVQPGDSIRITLYWQALKPLDRNYSVFLHLLDENDIEDQDQFKGQAYPGRGNLPTTTLMPGQTWAETWVMPIQSAAYAPARLTWEVGLFDAATLNGPRLSAVTQSGRALGDNLRFGQVGLARPAGSLFSPLSYNFVDQIELIGFDLDRRAARPGEKVNLTLFWRALAVPARDYTVFVHVLGERQIKAAAQDAQPSPPTSSWKLGQAISTTYELEVNPVPAGVYDTQVGVYFFTGESSFERLKVLTRDGRLQQDYVLLSKLRVTR